MKRDGLYTIGVRVVTKKDGKIEGLYVHGSRVGARVYPFDTLNTCEKDEYFLVFDDLQKAHAHIKELSRSYRFEFRSQANKLGVPRNDFGFYLLRLSKGVFDAFDFDSMRRYNGKNYIKLSFVK